MQFFAIINLLIINNKDSMKVYNTGDIRNIALAGNAGSGKSTLAENFALEGGKIQR